MKILKFLAIIVCAISFLSANNIKIEKFTNGMIVGGGSIGNGQLLFGLPYGNYIKYNGQFFLKSKMKYTAIVYLDKEEALKIKNIEAKVNWAKK